VVADGLAAGDRIVVSDLLPAIDGMLLRPVNAPEVAKQLLTTAGRSGSGE
jgi:hypothetical protein